MGTWESRIPDPDCVCVCLLKVRPQIKLFLEIILHCDRFLKLSTESMHLSIKESWKLTLKCQYLFFIIKRAKVCFLFQISLELGTICLNWKNQTLVSKQVPEVKTGQRRSRFTATLILEGIQFKWYVKLRKHSSKLVNTLRTGPTIWKRRYLGCGLDFSEFVKLWNSFQMFYANVEQAQVVRKWIWIVCSCIPSWSLSFLSRNCLFSTPCNVSARAGLIPAINCHAVTASMWRSLDVHCLHKKVINNTKKSTKLQKWGYCYLSCW